MIEKSALKKIADRWARGTYALRKDDQLYGHKLVELLRRNYSVNLVPFEDPLDAAIFVVLVDLLKEMEITGAIRILKTPTGPDTLTK
ncbi:MAG: hypothetical protein ABR887_00160 [Methanoregulaceae archaeon]|jgi:hypothetical protein